MSVGDKRKRNARCRNSICACTGECFIDDGTGDFAPKHEKKQKRKIKKYTKAEREKFGLDKMPENRFGEQRGRNPRIHEEGFEP